VTRLRPAALLLCAGLFAACSGNPPKVTRTSAQLLYVNDLEQGHVSEELAVHVVPEDKDGLDDLEYLHVISDKAELYWSLDSGTWSQLKSQNEDWIGSARLSMPANERFPRGEYRVMLYDLAGDSDEQRFTVDAELLEYGEVPFPQVTVTDRRITVTGTFGWYTILVYTSTGTFVKSFSTQSGLDVENIKRADSALRAGFPFYVYAYWARRNVGVLAGPYPVD